MSDMLGRPWIFQYFTEISENYHHKFSDVPVDPRIKRAQIAEFITYPSSPNDIIWAWLSDGRNIIPAMFTPESIVGIGAREEAIFGDPKDLELEPDMFLWMKDMREHANSRYLLKHPKEHQDPPENDNGPRPAP
ncbi:hypothetical protein BD410DRAFT_895407 [Rickenella mellea]|uniref:Uncharacterized protein n=1 Tax=Rickenella mellea TaxID=50990 RepID=A0A4Y7QEV7_9AGAM|nr:hypothetical protein BD410DRAFT_895407 [Rickenella mellea]